MEMDGVEEDKEENEEDKEIKEKKNTRPDNHEFKIEECLFCNKLFENLEENLEHMLKLHGFFLPEANSLVDLEGIIKYIGYRIGTEHVCLYCQINKFDSVSAVQDHMISKCHCKLLWDDNVDVGEYEDFYDFTKGYDADEPPLEYIIIII